MNTKLIFGIRIFLAAVFLAYGTLKLCSGQYYYGDWSMDRKSTDGTSLVWAFYGYSQVYGRFTGLFEAVPALLLLFRRTATLGASALFAVGLNITVMDFAYGFPSVKYCILGYTLLAAVLMVHDRERLRLLVRTPAEIAALAKGRAAGS